MSQINIQESGAPLPDEALSEELEDDALADIDLEDDQVVDDVAEESPRVLFPHLREISSLASWSVSSHKPHCGVAALRLPSPSSFWQSDGPQPHTLTLHFAKRVKIAYIRLLVNHELDESYTPTKIQLWAGTGYHDLSCVTEMNLDAPKGWLTVDLSNAGGPSEFGADENPWQFAAEAGEDLGDFYDDVRLIGDARITAEVASLRQQRRDQLSIGRGPTLRCFLIQVRVIENYQNGKDTHLRGFQVFAKDNEALSRRQRDALGEADRLATTSDAQKKSARSKGDEALDKLGATLQQPEWMTIPELR